MWARSFNHTRFHQSGAMTVIVAQHNAFGAKSTGFCGRSACACALCGRSWLALEEEAAADGRFGRGERLRLSTVFTAFGPDVGAGWSNRHTARRQAAPRWHALFC